MSRAGGDDSLHHALRPPHTFVAPNVQQADSCTALPPTSHQVQGCCLLRCLLALPAARWLLPAASLLLAGCCLLLACC